MQASRWEILGAWLRIWTPPRDVEIPPVPRWALPAVAATLGAGVVVWLVLIGPALDEAKDRDAAQQARADATFVRAQRARLLHDQRPHAARVARAARLYAAGGEARARATLLADVRTRVDRDARARVASGELDGPVHAMRCGYRPGDAGPVVHLTCLAVTSQTADATVGHPFVVAGSLRDGRYAWCHENPRPAEGAAGTDVAVPLPQVCRDP